MIRRIVAAMLSVGVVVLPACATGPARIGPELRDTPSLVEGAAGGHDVLALTRTVGVHSAIVRAPMARVWAVLPGVYADLGLRVTGVDTVAHMLGSIAQQIRRVAGRNPAAYFDCPGAYENLATVGDVTMSMRTQLVAQGDQLTSVRTQVSAAARSISSSQSVPCSGNGALEKLLVARLGAALASGGAAIRAPGGPPSMAAAPSRVQHPAVRRDEIPHVALVFQRES